MLWATGYHSTWWPVSSGRRSVVSPVSGRFPRRAHGRTRSPSSVGPGTQGPPTPEPTGEVDEHSGRRKERAAPMISPSPVDDDRGCLRPVLAVPLLPLTVIAADFCWTALTIRPSGPWDHGWADRLNHRLLQPSSGGGLVLRRSPRREDWMTAVEVDSPEVHRRRTGRADGTCLIQARSSRASPAHQTERGSAGHHGEPSAPVRAGSARTTAA